MGGKLVTLEDKQMIFELHKSGESNASISKKTGRNNKTISKILKEYGIQREARVLLSDSEKNKITNMYLDGMNTVEISKEVNRNQTTVERFLKRSGYTKFGKDSLSKEDIEKIKYEYQVNRLNAVEIHEKMFADRFSIPYIERVIRENGFSRGRGRGLYNKTMVHDYFSKIDTEEKAYILGYIYADGSVSNGKTLRLECVSEDVEILEFIESELNSGKEIHRYKREGKNETSVLNISSIDIIKDLENLGVVKRKQYKDIGLPKLEYSLLRHFVRGYFDGDGCATNNVTISICVTEKFGNDLIELFLKEGILKYRRKSTIIDMSKYGYNIMNVRITTNSEVSNFYNYIYKDSTFSLERKRNYIRDRIMNID